MRKRSGWPQWASILLLAALSFTIYANALAGEFVWDDNFQILRNQNIRSLDNIPQTFTSSLWSFTYADDSSSDRYYRPLQNIIFTLTYHFGGLSPFAYHFVSVLLHAVATIMVYLLLLEFGLLRSTSLFAAALFAVHPVHTEAVSWISGVGEVACGLFYFAALWTFLRYLRTTNARWLALSAMAFFLALLSKEMAVSFPIAAILIFLMKKKDLQLFSRKTAAAIAPMLAPFAIVMALYGTLRILAVGLRFAATFDNHVGAFDWLTFAVFMFGRYLRFAVLPYPLAILHNTPLYFSGRTLATCVYALTIAAVVLLLWFWRKTERNGLMWLAMFTVMIAPVFYFRGISGGSVFAERYLYIPTLPAMALLAGLWSRLPRKGAAVAAVCVIVVFSAGTLARNPDWRNEEVMYMRSLEAYPENSTACLNLAVVQLAAGKYSEAEQCLETARRHADDPGILHPQGENYQIEVVLGTLAARRNQSLEAKVHLNRAIRISPNTAEAYTILAGVLINLERDSAAAIPLLEKSIQFGPVDDQARDSMGVAHYNLKQFEQAIVYFQEALRINPESTRARQHLATAMRRAER